MSTFKVGDRVRYTYKPLVGNRFLPPFGALGVVVHNALGYTSASNVLFDKWTDPLNYAYNPVGVFLCDNDDLELIP